MPLLHAIGCLLGFGFAIAGVLSGGKVVMAQTGLSPLLLASLQYLLAGAALLVLLRPPLALWRKAQRHWVFYMICAIGGIAFPQVVVFLVVPHLGAGVTAMMYLFPPLLTYGFALGFAMERFDGLGLGGLLLGLLGGALLFWGQGLDAGGAQLWLAVAFLAPLSQAAGNIYRSKFWPADMPTGMFTAVILVFAGVLPLVISLMLPGASTLGALAPKHWGIIAASSAASGAGYFLFFYLQRRTGPVYVSQGGYVIAAFGILSGALLFGERLPGLAIIGAASVCCGIALYTLRMLKAGR